MLFMVIEKFKPGKTKEIYKRLEQKGRMMPPGMEYVDSWINMETERCFQLVEAEELALFKLWIAKWSDLADFEVVEVVSSKKAASLAKS